VSEQDRAAAAALTTVAAPAGSVLARRSLNLRAAFVAPPGSVILAADYKQVWSLLLVLLD
jgi:hypothetical protein